MYKSLFFTLIFAALSVIFAVAYQDTNQKFETLSIKVNELENLKDKIYVALSDDGKISQKELQSMGLINIKKTEERDDIRDKTSEIINSPDRVPEELID